MKHLHYLVLLAILGHTVPIRGQSLQRDLKIGTVSGGERYQFHQVRAVAQRATGEIVVLNAGGPDLRLYSSDGTFLRSMGGRGPGPGELQTPIHLVIGTNQLLVLDQGARLEIFDVDGNHIGSTSARAQNRSIFPLGFSAAGFLALSSPPRGPCTVPVVDGLCQDSTAVVPFDLGTRSVGQPIVAYPRPRRSIGVGERMAYGDTPLFEGAAVVAMDAQDRFYVSDPASYRIRLLDASGHETSVIGPQDHKPVPISESHIESYRRCMTALMASGVPSALMEGRLALRRPHALPAIGRLLVSSDGMIWVERTDLDPNPGEGECFRTTVQRRPRSSVWDRIDRSGRHLGRFTTPSEFVPMSATRDSLLGVELDELDVEYVVRYKVVSG